MAGELLQQLLALDPANAAQYRRMTAAKRAAALPGVRQQSYGPLGTYMTPGLQQLAQTLVQQAIGPSQEAVTRNAKSQADSLLGFTQAAAEIAKGFAPQTQANYSSAAGAQGAFAKGFSDTFRQLQNQSAGQANDLLAAQGSPQTVSGDKGGADALYGLGGYIPATQLNREGAAFTEAARQIPLGYLNQSNLDARGIWADANQRLQELTAQGQGQYGDVLQGLVSQSMQAQAAQDARKALGLDTKAKKLDIASQKLQNALATAEVTGVFVDPRTGKKYPIPQGADPAANVDVTLSRELGAWVDGSGFPIPWLQGVKPPGKTKSGSAAKPVFPEVRESIIKRADDLAVTKEVPNPKYDSKRPSVMKQQGVEPKIEVPKYTWDEAYKMMLRFVPPRFRKQARTKQAIRDALIAAGFKPPKKDVEGFLDAIGAFP